MNYVKLCSRVWYNRSEYNPILFEKYYNNCWEANYWLQQMTVYLVCRQMNALERGNYLTIWITAETSQSKWLADSVFNSIELVSRFSNCLVVKAPDSQSRGPVFKINGWLQSSLNYSSFRDRYSEYQEFLGTKW